MSMVTKPARSGWTLAGIALAMTLVSGGAAVALTSSGAATGAPAAHAGGPWLAQARSALVRYLRHDGAPAAIAPTPGALRGALLPASSTFSYNWSGYADTSSTKGAFSAVAGKWTTPSVKCTAEDMITSEWVGIDGWGDRTVEQDGTLDWCFEGHATYFTWYEMYPAATVEVGRSLHPGDQVAASVTRKATSYTLSLTDSTHAADSFTKKATCAASTCLDISAEWVAERPEFATTGFAPLASYGKWSVGDGTVTSGAKAGTISSFHPLDINMVDSTDTYQLSTSSGLTAGKAFTTTWNNSY